MPSNKNAYIRYRAIDQCLNKTYRYYNATTLLKAVSDILGEPVSESTLAKDIRFMKEDINIQAPIKFDRLRGRYYYAKPFSMTGLNLDDDEENVLNMSLSMLDMLKETKYAKSYKSLIQKIITQANATDKASVIEFEQSVNQPNAELFDKLYEAILNKEALIISYQAYGKVGKDHVVSPYMIKEFRNRFYLVGLKHDESKKEALIYCFGMDRIKKVKKSKVPYVNTKEFSSKNYFKYSMGITRKLFEEPIEFILKFSSLNAPYVLSKPLHQTQKILEQTKDFLIISIKVYESHELNMAVLSYGSGVEVLSPTGYINYLKNEIKNMTKLYQKK